MDSTKEEKPCIFLRYPKIFWDNPKIASASPKELYAMVNRWRASDDPLEQLEFKDFLRRMVERGSLSDAHIFLKPEEVREFLLNEILYCMDNRVAPLWKKFAGLPDDFPIITRMNMRQFTEKDGRLAAVCIPTEYTVSGTCETAAEARSRAKEGKSELVHSPMLASNAGVSLLFRFTEQKQVSFPPERHI